MKNRIFEVTSPNSTKFKGADPAAFAAMFEKLSKNGKVLLIDKINEAKNREKALAIRKAHEEKIRIENENKPPQEEVDLYEKLLSELAVIKSELSIIKDEREALEKECEELENSLKEEGETTVEPENTPDNKNAPEEESAIVENTIEDTTEPANINTEIVEEKNNKLTKDAEDLLSSINEGSKPAFITNNLRRIAKENGIEVTDKSTPDEIINSLREKQVKKVETIGTNNDEDKIKKQVEEIKNVMDPKKEMTIEEKIDAMEESKREELGPAQIKVEIEKIIKGDFVKKLEENGLEYKWLDISNTKDGFHIVANFKGNWARGKPKFIADIVNNNGGIKVVNHYLDANPLVSALAPKDKINNMAKNLGEDIKKYIENSRKREIKRLDIENGVLKVTYTK